MNIVDEHDATSFSDRIWNTFLERSPAGFNARAAAFLEQLLTGASLLWDETTERSDRADKVAATILLALQRLEKAERAPADEPAAPEVLFLVHDTVSAKEVRGRYNELAEKLGMAPAGMLLSDDYTPGLPDAGDAITGRHARWAPNCLVATPEALRQAADFERTVTLSRLKLLVFVDVDVITAHGRSGRLAKDLPQSSPQFIFLTERPSEAVDAFVHDIAPQAARVVFAKRIDEKVRDPRIIERVAIVGNWEQRLELLPRIFLHPELADRRWLLLCRPERVRDWRPKLDLGVIQAYGIPLVELWTPKWQKAELQRLEGLRSGAASGLVTTFACMEDLERAAPDVDGVIFLDWPKQSEHYLQAQRLIARATHLPAISLLLLRLMYAKDVEQTAKALGRELRFGNPFCLATRIDRRLLIQGDKDEGLTFDVIDRTVLRLDEVESLGEYEDDVEALEQLEDADLDVFENVESTEQAAAEPAQSDESEAAAPVRRTLTIRAGYVPSKVKPQVPQIEINEPLSSNTVELRAAQARERRSAGKTGGPLTHQLADKHGRIRRLRDDKRRSGGEMADDGDSILGGMRSAPKKAAVKHGKKPQRKAEQAQRNRKDRRQKNAQSDRKDFKRRQQAERAEEAAALAEVLEAGTAPADQVESAQQSASGRHSMLRTPRSQRLKKLHAQKKDKRMNEQREPQPGAPAPVVERADEAAPMATAPQSADAPAKKSFKQRFKKKFEKRAPHPAAGAQAEQSAPEAKPKRQKKTFDKKPKFDGRRVDDDNFGNSIHYKPKGGAASYSASGFSGITGAGASPASSSQFLTSSLYGGRSHESAGLTMPQSMTMLGQPAGLTGAVRTGLPGLPGKKGKKTFGGQGKPFKRNHAKNKKNGQRGS